MKTTAWPGQLRQDLWYGVRLFRRRPGFTVAATLMLALALGMSAPATVYSLLDAALVKPLPVHKPEELAHIYTSCRARDVCCSSSYPELLAYRSQSRTFADMAVFANRRECRRRRRKLSGARPRFDELLHAARRRAVPRPPALALQRRHGRSRDRPEPCRLVGAVRRRRRKSSAARFL